METLVNPEGPKLDSVPTERDESVFPPVEETQNPSEGNAEEKSPFAVGDLVWAKTTGHPWWPALISRPSESADRTVKSQRKAHSVLVTYFGDGDNLSWCEPKQLKPFFEVFDEMSKQSRSVSFLAAMGSCVEDIGRCLELEMTCRCVSGETPGKLLSGDACKKLPVANYSPLEFLNRVRDVVRDVGVARPLDVVRLRSWVFAFGKGFLQGDSWVFQQRREIVDLVDKIDLEEEGEGSQSGNGVLEGPDVASKKPQRGEKRRSMSKLIAEMDLDIIEVDGDEEEPILVSKKRNRKTDIVMTEEEAGSSSGRRERKKSKYLSPPYTNMREVGKFLSSFSKRMEAMSPRRPVGFSAPGVTGFSAINKCSGEEDDDKIPLSQIESTPACEIFSEFISTAAYPLHLKRNPSARVVKHFFAMYRSFIYSDGAGFEDYNNLVHEYIAKNEDAEKDTGKPGSHKKNSKHGGYQVIGLKLKKPKSEHETKLESKQQKNNHSEKQKVGDKRVPKVAIRKDDPFEFDLPLIDHLNEGKEKQKLSRGKKSGENTSQEAPVELSLPLVDNLNAGKKKQKPSRGKKSRVKTTQRAPDELDPPLVDDLNEGIQKQKPSKGKKSGDKTSQGAPAELDLDMVDDLNEGKEKQKPSRGMKSLDRTNQGAPFDLDLPLVDDLNEGKEKQKLSSGKKSEDRTSQGALLALECFREDTSSKVKGKKTYGSKLKKSKIATSLEALVDSDTHMADVSHESQRKQKPGWKRKMLSNATTLQPPVDLVISMEDDPNEGEPGKGRKRWMDDINAEAEAQKMVSRYNEGDSEEKEGVSNYAAYSNDEVGIDIEPMSCRKPVIEKKMGSKVNPLDKGLQILGDRLAKLEGSKSGRKKKNSESPLNAKSGRRKDNVSGTCFEGQAALQLTFHSGITLPSIEDLVTTYSKYGVLIDSRIELFKESNSALVVFATSADAESAFKDKAGPYGSVATYRLRYLPENHIPPQIPFVCSPTQLIPNITSAAQQLPDLNSAVQKPPLPYIRKSLETMISTLAGSPSLINNAGPTSDGLKPEARENLVGEMQGLLHKVEKMLNGAGPGSSAL